MTMTNRWAIVSECHGIGEYAFEAKLVFADPAWAPDTLVAAVAFIETASGDIDKIILNDAPPMFGIYNETDEQRTARLRRAIFDATFNARFYAIESSKLLPKAPFPIVFDARVRVHSLPLVQRKLRLPLLACEVFMEGINRVAKNSMRHSDVIVSVLQGVAENSLLSDADCLAVSWGPGRTCKGVFVNSETPMVYYSSDSVPPNDNIHVLTSDIMIGSPTCTS